MSKMSSFCNTCEDNRKETTNINSCGRHPLRKFCDPCNSVFYTSQGYKEHLKTASRIKNDEKWLMSSVRHSTVPFTYMEQCEKNLGAEAQDKYVK